MITGERPVQETEGRVYQQVEIEAGPFRRIVELGADVVAERARGDLRGRDPAGRAAARAAEVTRQVPIDRSAGRDVADDEGDGIQVVETRQDGSRRRFGEAEARSGPSRCRRRCRCCRSRTRSPTRTRLTPLAVGQERSMKLVDDVLGGERMLVMVASRDPELDETRARASSTTSASSASSRGCSRSPTGRCGSWSRRPSGSGSADYVAEEPYLVARIEELPDVVEHDARARGADPQRAAHLLGDHRADPVPARGAAARGHQHRGPLGARAPDRRLAADPDRGEAGAARGGQRHPAAAAALASSSPASSR